ncbi:flagellin [Loktanella salsilacus]|jgi:flagellin|uniref:Flagellin n=1 Tax=Loktanella salsilacus TaxID=195913 RepID=A0A1I4GIP4_9RHOB|nr:flagellin [Loktanella salsilacus]MBU0781182.1 flagellar protein [Alphaproteobacteria bacterium]MBU0862554.1 flagellar protein [Alphaproteobacteria bacterium]MBU1836200.1 flagellar protein [Alphaproteobacteria bacterium]UTH46561.1 flagellar protein [Loktanella salsilacus]UTH50214.1 flagellar protein [Loktanella salsilacus]|tara:strand:+ start:11890 stop:12726 length:837 start_codon:yes stop_codon:yes gene_type:complete
MSSILTNTSAMNALSTLRGVNDRLGETQNRISTGLKVNSAKDNASYFSISTTMDSESGMNKAINSGLTLAKNSVSTGRLGAETMVDLAQQFVDRLAFAQTEGVDQDAIQKELSSLAAQMKTSIAQSSFNGENLLTAAGSGPKEIVSGVSRSGGSLSTTVIKYDATNLEAVQASFEAFSIDNTTSSADLQTALQTAEGFLSTVTGAATDLGIAEKSIETQQNFLSELTNRLDSGVGSMIDADMEEEAARLQSLQVQQQLATQSLSIANQAPQNILSLFK